MGIEPRRKLILKAAPIVSCLLSVTLIYATFFGAYNYPTDPRMQPFSNSKSNPGTTELDNKAIEEQESLKLCLRRLVRGVEQSKFDDNGFACEIAVHTVICLAENQPVRIETETMSIHVPSYDQTMSQGQIMVQPYAYQEYRDFMKLVTPVRILQEKTTVALTPPACSYTHNVPVIIFSSGIIGNLYHEISEIIIPLFITSRHFQSRVQFLVTDYQPWFVQKYKRVLSQLSQYAVINPTSNRSVHCFPGAVVGLKYHGYLALNSSNLPEGHSMLEFRKFLRETYSLKIKNAKDMEQPTLLLISRERTRTFVNEDKLIRMIEQMGFRVIITKTEKMLNVDEFAKVVNSCSVMIGAHGAGLTNEVFLPDRAVVVQVVPYALTWASDTYYGKPAEKMGLKYIEYKILPEESSLIDVYGPDHPVIVDPDSVLSKGYQAAKQVYLDGQNITINLTRFRAALVEAPLHLEHPAPSN